METRHEELVPEQEMLITHLNNEIVELYDFIQYLEASTICKDTSDRIRNFLIQKGLWNN